MHPSLTKIPNKTKRGSFFFALKQATTMNEEFFLRFPQLGEDIFKELNNQSLVKCKRVDRTWNSFLVDQRFILMRKIRKTTGLSSEFRKLWKTFPTSDTFTSEDLQRALMKFFENYQKLNTGVFYGVSFEPNELNILHLAAGIGNLTVWKNLTKTLCNLNLCDKNGATPLHYAAFNGHLQICHEIVANIDDKNPSDNFGFTPLHFAAYQGHLEILQDIIHQVEDKNPKCKRGNTPLHYATIEPHLQIFEEIINVIENKHPRNNIQVRPFHIAAKLGHFEICKYILEHAEDKNPIGILGFTPLHVAAIYGHQKICDLIRENVEDQNPLDDIGRTPKFYCWLGMVLRVYMGAANILKKTFTKKQEKRTVSGWLY